jgi:hypothetical protein
MLARRQSIKKSRSLLAGVQNNSQARRQAGDFLPYDPTIDWKWKLMPTQKLMQG